jgi:hypothetical protein
MSKKRKFKLTSSFICGTIILIVGWIYELGFWMLAIFKMGNKELKYKPEDEALMWFIGLISLTIALVYSFIYVLVLKEKLNNIK